MKKTHVDTSQLLLELIGHSEHGPVEVLFLAEFEEVLERSRLDQRKGGPDLLNEEDDLVVVDVGVLESGKDLGGLLVSALLDQPTGGLWEAHDGADDCHSEDDLESDRHAPGRRTWVEEIEREVNPDREEEGQRRRRAEMEAQRR